MENYKPNSIELHRKRFFKRLERITLAITNIAFIGEVKNSAYIQCYSKDGFGAPIIVRCVESYNEVLALINIKSI